MNLSCATSPHEVQTTSPLAQSQTNLSDLQSVQTCDITASSGLQADATKFMEEVEEIASTIPAVISTMTVLIVLDSVDSSERMPLDLTKILEAFETDEIQQFISDVTGDSKAIYTSSKRTFNNSIVFKCRNVPTEDGTVLDKQAVKVFCNGNVHITGVKRIQDALYLGDVFVTMIELMYGGDGLSKMFSFKSFDVQLINLYFQVPLSLSDKVLDLVKVKEYLQRETPYYVCYNTERHAGVIVKAVEFTLLVFDTGNVIISSIKRPSQLAVVRDFIKEHIIGLPNCGTLVEKEVLKYGCKRPKRDFDYSQYLVLK